MANHETQNKQHLSEQDLDRKQAASIARLEAQKQREAAAKGGRTAHQGAGDQASGNQGGGMHEGGSHGAGGHTSTQGGGRHLGNEAGAKNARAKAGLPHDKGSK